MDKYYGNVCELDIIFNFQKAYFILDELLLAGEMQESSKKNVLRCISQQDSLEDMEVSGAPFDCQGPLLLILWHQDVLPVRFWTDNAPALRLMIQALLRSCDGYLIVVYIPICIARAFSSPMYIFCYSEYLPLTFTNTFLQAADEVINQLEKFGFA